jgi:hypothetical protein
MAIVLDGTNGIDTPDLASAGPVSGTTGTFSGAVQASGVATNLYPLVSGTAVASTSGTSIDFTGIPSWVKRITVMFSGVSTNGTSLVQIQLGAGSVATSGYLASATNNAAASIATVASTAGFAINSAAAANSFAGQLVFSLISGNGWVALGSFSNGGSNVFTTAGGITLGGTLDRVRVTTVNGTDAFDAGSINIMYE